MAEIGFRGWLGVEYLETSDKHAVVAIRLDSQKRNHREVAHGGIVASLIDVAMGTAASGGNYETRSRLVATLEMKVNYLSPATGEQLVARAEVLRAGSRTLVTRCEVRTDDDQVCAVGLGTFIVRRGHKNDPVHLQEHGGEA